MREPAPAVTARVVAYLRQSDTDDEGEKSLSLRSQEADLRARCAREGWAVVGVLKDPDVRGWRDEMARPGLAEALAMAARREYDLLLVWDVSRLARSIEFQERWIRILLLDGVEVESHTESDVRRTPFIRQIRGVINEERTREIAKHTRRALDERARRGLWQGRLPWGYVRRGKDESIAPTADAATVAVIRRIFAERAVGAGYGAIANGLHADGILAPRGVDWFHGTVGRIVRNPVYRGAFASRHGVVEGAHEGIVAVELWRAAQTPYAGRARVPRVKRSWSWVEGLVWHSCGQPMYATSHGGEGRAVVLRCRMSPNWRNCATERACRAYPNTQVLSRAEPAIWARIVADLSGLAALSADRVVAAAQRELGRAAPLAEQAGREATARRERARARLAKAEELYLSGARDRAWFGAEDARAAAEVVAAEADLAELPATPDAAGIAAALDEARSLAGLLAMVEGPAARGDVLRALGVAVLEPAGWRIAYAPRFAALFAHRDR